MFRVGVTGTRVGMTQEQKNQFAQMLTDLYGQWGSVALHHGDCLGADADAHELFVAILAPTDGFVIIHPPLSPSQRAFCGTNEEWGDQIVIWPKREYLTRNMDIVANSDRVFAFPRGTDEVRRSGTWATIREARRQQTSLTIIYPDGTFEEE